MAEHRPFPPSERRRQLAHQTGLSAASRFVVGAAAATAALIATAAVRGRVARQLGAAIAAACRGQPVLRPADAIAQVGSIALPILGAAAVAAAIAQLAQTRTAWLPRRRIRGAPALDAGPGPRTRRTAGELAAAGAIGGVAFAWLWRSAPQLAALTELADRSEPTASAPLLAGAATLLISLGGALAAAWIVTGVLDAIARRAAYTRALAMTAADKREDDRLTGADPRWRSRRAQFAGGAPDTVAGAAVVVLGDGAAVAIAWDPVRQPIPVRTATGRGPRATQLVALARRHAIAVHRDPALAAVLVDGDGPISEPHWPRLAAIVAAARGRDRIA
jgi:flagellar biosynthesis protein FlhB